MWPRQGQGAAQSVEDAATLGVLMGGITDLADVSRRLEMYDALRVRRSSIVQLLSRTREVSDETTGMDLPLHEEITGIFERLSPDWVPGKLCPGLILGESPC
jgi:2-polyprenyl-6-methoxyphenol hydroxylase-like FAD-dependent oxidoreductase